MNLGDLRREARNFSFFMDEVPVRVDVYEGVEGTRDLADTLSIRWESDKPSLILSVTGYTYQGRLR